MTPSVTPAIAYPTVPTMSSRGAFKIMLLFFTAALLYLTAYLRVVPLRHILFVLITALYACLANIVIRRTVMPPGPLAPRSLSPTKNSVRLLFPYTVIFSLLVPAILLYAAGISVEGNPTSLGRILAPPLFLVICQISLEAIGFLFPTVFTVYVRLGVTLAFVCYRIPVMFTWYQEARQWAQSADAALVPPIAVALTQIVAVVNIVFWTFGLLCFLLLYCLPSVIQDPQVTTRNNSRQTEKAS